MPGSLIGSFTFLKTGLDPMGATERALQGRRSRTWNVWNGWEIHKFQPGG